MKAVVAKFELEDPRIPRNMFAALGNIKPSHLWDDELASGARRGRAACAKRRIRAWSYDGFGPLDSCLFLKFLFLFFGYLALFTAQRLLDAHCESEGASKTYF